MHEAQQRPFLPRSRQAPKCQQLPQNVSTARGIRRLLPSCAHPGFVLPRSAHQESSSLLRNSDLPCSRRRQREYPGMMMMPCSEPRAIDEMRRTCTFENTSRISGQSQAVVCRPFVRQPWRWRRNNLFPAPYHEGSAQIANAFPLQWPRCFHAPMRRDDGTSAKNRRELGTVDLPRFLAGRSVLGGRGRG